MLVKSLVLNGNLSFLHISRNVLIAHPDTVLRAEELALLDKLAGFFVLDENSACLVHRLSLKVDTRRLIGEGKDVNRDRNARDNSRD